MIHKFKEEFYIICKEILKENKKVEEWSEIESDDLFQGGIYEGGFDATEMEFCFSVYENNNEYLFQFPLDLVQIFYSRSITEIEVTNAD
jgi:hypothetical protein